VSSTVLGLEGYWHWVIGYWAIFAQILGSTVVGWYFFLLWHPIVQYRSDSSQHRPHDNHLDICGAAIVSRRRQGEWDWGERRGASSSYSFIIWYSVAYISLHNQCIAMLHTSIRIGIG